MNDCPVCGLGTLTAEVGVNQFWDEGKKVLLTFHYSVCSHCKSEVADHLQTALNKELREKHNESPTHDIS